MNLVNFFRSDGSDNRLHITFNTEVDIIYSITRFLNETRDVISLGSTSKRLYSILLAPLALPFFAIFMPEYITISRGRTMSRNSLSILSSPGSIAIWDFPTTPSPENRSYINTDSGNNTDSDNSVIDLENVTSFAEDYANRGSDSENELVYDDNEQNIPDFTQNAHDLRYAGALRNNTDGGDYLKSVIDEHLQKLEKDEKQEFETKVQERDPQLFISIPRWAVDKAISSSTPLTEENTPHFMHTNLDALENLRQEKTKLLSRDLENKSYSIAFNLARQTDCIASIQRALQQ
jgi:hypothetical protein